MKKTFILLDIAALVLGAFNLGLIWYALFCMIKDAIITIA